MPYTIKVTCHYGRDSVSNYQPHHCLFNPLFRSKKTSTLRVTGLCFHLMTSSCCNRCWNILFKCMVSSSGSATTSLQRSSCYPFTCDVSRLFIKTSNKTLARSKIILTNGFVWHRAIIHQTTADVLCFAVHFQTETHTKNVLFYLNTLQFASWPSVN